MEHARPLVAERLYDPAQSIVFRKTREAFGGFSNMAAGYPLEVGGLRIRTTEALYQACRFPHRPALQRDILDATSPMTAKALTTPHHPDTRPDWHRARIAVMRWVLRLKLAQHWDRFGQLLRDSGDLPIVENSQRDRFWGASPQHDGRLAGANVLGRLLMELRQVAAQQGRSAFAAVEPPPLPDFLLIGRPIGVITTGPALPCALANEHHPGVARNPPVAGPR